MRKSVQNMMNHKDMHKYDDMLHLAHPVSRTHPPMRLIDRAAQFAPFAALTGHSEAVKETARVTEEQIELDEDQKAVLDRQLQEIQRQSGREPVVSITYFVPDLKKPGGSYVTVTGGVKRIKEYERMVLLKDGTSIPIEAITEIVRKDEKYLS